MNESGLHPMNFAKSSKTYCDTHVPLKALVYPPSLMLSAIILFLLDSVEVVVVFQSTCSRHCVVLENMEKKHLG